MRALNLWSTPLHSQLYPFGSLLSEIEQARRAYKPEWALHENTDHVLVSIDVPGVERDKIGIEVKDDQLVISGERSPLKDEQREGVLGHCQRHYGKFEQRFNLGKGLNTSNIKASLNNGVLDIFIPKMEEVRPTRIEISEHPLERLQN